MKNVNEALVMHSFFIRQMMSTNCHKDIFKTIKKVFEKSAWCHKYFSCAMFTRVLRKVRILFLCTQGLHIHNFDFCGRLGVQFNKLQLFTFLFYYIIAIFI